MKNRAKITFIIGSCFLFFSCAAFAATLNLKDGKVVEGDIVSRDDTYVKMNLQGVELTYWADEIESLRLNDGTKVAFGATPSVAASAPAVNATPASPVVPEPERGPLKPMPPAEPLPQQTPAPQADLSSPAMSMTPESIVSQKMAATFPSGPLRATLSGTHSGQIAGAVFLFALIFGIGFYAYFSYCLQLIAAKTGTANGWWGWIPIANLILMCDIASKPRWWAALFLAGVIPFVGVIAVFIVSCIIQMDIAVRRGKPNWWGVLMSLPLVNIVAYGYLAFSS